MSIMTINEKYQDFMSGRNSYNYIISIKMIIDWIYTNDVSWCVSGATFKTTKMAHVITKKL